MESLADRGLIYGRVLTYDDLFYSNSDEELAKEIALDFIKEGELDAEYDGGDSV